MISVIYDCLQRNLFIFANLQSYMIAKARREMILNDYMKKKALSQFLRCPENQIFRGEYGIHSYTYINIDYLILTPEEADAEARRQVWSFIHTFDYEFLCRYLPVELPQEKLANLLKQSCECCLQFIAALIPNYEQFLDAAIEKYGRAYFLCFADKTEYKVEYDGSEYVVYRLV